MNSLDDDLNELALMMAEMQQLVADFNPPSEDFSVEDEDKQIRVDFSADGKILNFKIAARWNEVIAKEEFVDRVNSVVAEGQMKALGVDMDAVIAGDVEMTDPDEPVTVTPEMRDKVEDMVARNYEQLLPSDDDQPEVEMDEDITVLGEQLAQAAAEAASLGNAPTPELDDYRYYNESGTVSLVYSEGFFSDIEFREGWFEQRSGTVLSSALNEILEQIGEQDGNDLHDVISMFKA